jgi:ribosomal-protein-alanine N-acetyltransferase
MSTTISVISTPRLDLVPARVDLAERVVEFYKRNDVHLAPWNPPKPEYFHTEAFQHERLLQAEVDAVAGTAMRWWLCLRNQPHILVGSIGLTAIARGPFQNAMLGYALDGQLQGRGLMSEGLAAIIKFVFSPEVHLHRIQANVRPENLPSLRLLEQLGFEREGFARDYLFIDGAWRDHAMLALRNGEFTGVPI